MRRSLLIPLWFLAMAAPLACTAQTKNDPDTSAGADAASDSTSDTSDPMSDTASDTNVDAGSDTAADSSTDTSIRTDTDALDTVETLWCDDLPAIATPGEASAAYARSICEAWSRCGLAVPLHYGASSLDVAQCVEVYQSRIRPEPAVAPSVQQGYVQFDAEAAQSCIHELCAFRCDLLQAKQEPTSCAGIFRGTVAVGEACVHDVECISGRCDRNASCPGVCVRGTPCSVPCASGEYCEASTQQCRPLAQAGAACEAGGCAADLYCDPAVGVCIARKAAGVACGASLECQPGLFCGGRPAACGLPGYARAAGEACAPLLDACAWPNVCRTSGAPDHLWTCQPAATPGEACSTGFDCAGYCNAAAGQCEALSPENAPCVDPRQCQGTCGADGACKSARLQGGQACLSNEGCESLVCARAPEIIALPGWTAFNDLCWGLGQPSDRITRYTVANGPALDGTSGQLVDSATGDVLPVVLAVSGGDWGSVDNYTKGAPGAAGTDAARVFGTLVDTTGVVNYDATPVGLTFTGLDPARTYKIMVFSNRDDPSFTDRLTRTTLTSADAFTNTSSTGASFSGPSDPSVVIVAGYNTQTGYIARFEGIDPGSDGRVRVDVTDGGSADPPRYYVNAVALMLEPKDVEIFPEPGLEPPTCEFACSR